MKQSILKEFEPEARMRILAGFAKRGQLDDVMSGYEYIFPYVDVDVLGGATFHEWLLTNPDERAFDIWLKIRDAQKKYNIYAPTYYKNSAALIIYANLPERLDSLEDNEWEGTISLHQLKKANIHFRFNNHATDIAKEKINELIDSNQCGVAAMSAMEVSALQGSIELIRRSKRYMYKPNFYSYYVLNGDGVDVNAILEMMKDWFPASNNRLERLFKSAALHLNVKQLSTIWGKMNKKQKQHFYIHKDYSLITRGILLQEKIDVADYSLITRGLLLQEKIDVAEYLLSLENEHWRPNDYDSSLSIDILTMCVANGLTKSVEFILKHNPELLEEKVCVYETPKQKRVGTALEIAIINANQNMVDTLLSHGARTDSLVDMLSFLSTENYLPNAIESIIITEKILLSKDLLKKDSHTNGCNVVKTSCAGYL